MATLQGRVAVVTGGAGGLGEAICTALAQAGCTVAVGYHRSRDAAEALARRLPPTGMPHLALACPVTDSAALADAAQTVAQRFGRCDVLVNGAGITRFVPHADLDALDDALIDDVLTTNVRGVIAAVRAFKGLLSCARAPLPASPRWGEEEHRALNPDAAEWLPPPSGGRAGEGGLRTAHTSLIVNISSIAAVTAMGSNIAYCASKAAVDNLTRSMARALAPAVRVVSVSPGLSDTQFVQQLDPAWRAEQAGRTPLGRLALPEEVAAAVVAAATHLTFSTGVVIPVDGGRPLA